MQGESKWWASEIPSPNSTPPIRSVLVSVTGKGGNPPWGFPVITEAYQCTSKSRSTLSKE